MTVPEDERPTLSELAADAGGLRCAKCGCGDFWTVRTINHQKGFVLRRRECRECKHRFTTTERVLGPG